MEFEDVLTMENKSQYDDIDFDMVADILQIESLVGTFDHLDFNGNLVDASETIYHKLPEGWNTTFRLDVPVIVEELPKGSIKVASLNIWESCNPMAIYAYPIEIEKEEE
jgi:hypothetical protein